MDWLADCASIIAHSGEPVRWTTPLKLPVVQPYRCEEGRRRESREEQKKRGFRREYGCGVLIDIHLLI